MKAPWDLYQKVSGPFTYLGLDLLHCASILPKLLTRLWRRSLSYRNQSIDLQSKSMDWFLYDNSLRHERVKPFGKKNNNNASADFGKKLIQITMKLLVAHFWDYH